jgi:hypothetical protein
MKVNVKIEVLGEMGVLYPEDDRREGRGRIRLHVAGINQVEFQHASRVDGGSKVGEWRHEGPDRSGEEAHVVEQSSGECFARWVEVCSRRGQEGSPAVGNVGKEEESSKKWGMDRGD